MSLNPAFAPFTNGTRLPWPDVPEWPADELVNLTAAALDKGARLCAWFGLPEKNGTRLVAILAHDSESMLSVARSEAIRGAYPALTLRHVQAHLFEREIWEQHQLKPEGHPWLKPLRAGTRGAPVHGSCFQVDGAEVHEVAVGPVHAGVIEPGHFRFQCDGERVLHLDIGLGYQHRGLEQALVGGPHRATLSQVEAIAGDSTIAHTTAYAQTLEALAGFTVSPQADWIRAVALELERLAAHTGDCGGLALDVAFQPTASACGKLRGDFLNLTALLCGNRFGRGLVRPGGCRHGLEDARCIELLDTLDGVVKEANEAIGWLWDSSSARERFEGVGTLSKSQARELGLVGLASRATGIPHDARLDHPTGPFKNEQFPVSVETGGDVLARGRLRHRELSQSGAFLRRLLSAPPEVEEQSLKQLSLAPDCLAVSLVEGWRGPVCHLALTSHTGSFRLFKIIDPSFHNWPGLALCLRGQAISDFPICNKSFNLSYCGFDL